jgi:hypothetical protein
MEKFVSTCRSVATQETEQCVENDDDGSESAAVARGKEAEKRECCD